MEERYEVTVISPLESGSVSFSGRLAESYMGCMEQKV